MRARSILGGPTASDFVALASKVEAERAKDQGCDQRGSGECRRWWRDVQDEHHRGAERIGDGRVRIDGGNEGEGAVMDFLLDETTWDFALDDAGNLQTVTGRGPSRNTSRSASGSSRGEWALDTREGTPYWEEILIRGASDSVVSEVFRRVVAETPGSHRSASSRSRSTARHEP